MVRTTVRNPEGKVVGSTQNTMPAHTHQACIELKLPAITLKDPQLWSYNTPQLYSADVVVVADGMVVDSITEQFGVRKLEFSPEFGFKLNGEKIFLQGNANHHDLGALGAASYDRAIERMMLQLKAFGYNTIRCSHNPSVTVLPAIADRVGMLIVDELTDKWSDNDYWGGRRPLTQIWSDLIIEWIKRDRNRPSIILWSLGNELQIREGWVGFGGINDWGITTYRIFNQLVKRFDDSRLTNSCKCSLHVPVPSLATTKTSTVTLFHPNWLVPQKLLHSTISLTSTLLIFSINQPSYCFKVKPRLTNYWSLSIIWIENVR